MMARNGIEHMLMRIQFGHEKKNNVKWKSVSTSKQRQQLMAKVWQTGMGISDCQDVAVLFFLLSKRQY